MRSKRNQKSGNSNENLSKGNHNNRNNGEKGSDKIEDDSYKGMGSKVREVDGNEGFDGDLNGNDDCVEVVNEDEDEEVVKQANVGSQTCGSKGVGMRLADMLGSQNWSLTVCGQFIDCSMGFNKARYHIRRMWYRFGLKDVIAENGVFYFKFQDEEGINEVINNVEPKRIPVWVKMRNVPMKAWSVKGISALPSSIGKPVIMDEITTKMCITGVGRIGFARVLVEIDAEKGIKDKIEIMYKSKNINKFCKKISKCGIEEGSVEKKDNEFKTVQNRKYGRNGFNMNKNSNRQNGQYDRMWNDRRNVRVNTKWQTNKRFEYRRRNEDERKGKRLEDNEGINVEVNGMKRSKEQDSGGSRSFKDNDKECQEGSTSANKSNRNGMKIVDEALSKVSDDKNGGMNEDMKRYCRDRKELFNAAKEIEENEDVMEESVKVSKRIERIGSKNREAGTYRIVWKTERVSIEKRIERKCEQKTDRELCDKNRQSDKVSKRIERFRRKIEKRGIHLKQTECLGVKELRDSEQKQKEMIILIFFLMDLKFGAWNIRGLCSHSDKQKEVKRLIKKGGLQFCAVLETHVKYKNIKKAWLISKSRQYMFFLMETIDRKSKFFCTMIYASNSGMKRRKLWKDLEIQKIITNGIPWVILGDFNVTLKVSEHSNVVKMPNGVQKRKGSFRFSNFITDKKEFLPTVRSVWNKKFEGHTMAEQLRIKVKECQADVDKFPHDENVKEKRCEYEIKNAMFDIEDSKAPGPDGYTARFYKSAWSIIGKEVCQTVKDFFLNGKLLGEVNATLISLVPKIPTPDKVSDFRPIACCNVMYKCIRELTKGKAKVSWDKICKPKDQGGLGLKNLGVWNEVLMIKHLWNVAVKKDTLWVKWIYMEKLKDISIWEAQCDDKSTVGWKNILSLRDKVRKHIGWKLGNGKSVNIWYDKWCSISPLSDFIDTRDIYDARLSNNCTVSDLINEGRWKWPAVWRTDFVDLSELQVPILSDDIEDTAVWISQNGNEKKFKISNVWKDMNCQEEKVDWHILVWFAQSIPRHAFVTWLAIRERLMTQDKIMLWRPNEDLKCALCSKLSESWDQIISEMKALPLNRNIWSIVRRIVCNAAVYYIWQERNNRIFKNKKRDKDTIFNMIKDTVVMKLIGLRVKKSITVNEVEEKWKIKLQRG
ncbi:RNA-directed DNA polymerase, eukaryota, reverse transcriptase zinc-binding domain protein [Tanacetum coccineum]